MPALSNSRAQVVLYESEAALRLVDNELNELHDVAETGASAGDAPDVAALIEGANAQIKAVLARLREGRAAIEGTTVGKVKLTRDKLREVTSATEDAAINIMDACDRANSLVDELDTIDTEGATDQTKAANIRGSLRDELFLMMGALQFQDITSQQLAHASAVLEEMEQRMIEVAKLFDPATMFEMPKAQSVVDRNALAYDTEATTLNAESRQSLADEIFTAVKVHAA